MCTASMHAYLRVLVYHVHVCMLTWERVLRVTIEVYSHVM